MTKSAHNAQRDFDSGLTFTLHVVPTVGEEDLDVVLVEAGVPEHAVHVQHVEPAALVAVQSVPAARQQHRLVAGLEQTAPDGDSRQWTVGTPFVRRSTPNIELVTPNMEQSSPNMAL